MTEGEKLVCQECGGPRSPLSGRFCRPCYMNSLRNNRGDQHPGQSKRWSDEKTVSLVREMYADRCTIRQIALAVGVSSSTISQFIERNGILREPLVDEDAEGVNYGGEWFWDAATEAFVSQYFRNRKVVAGDRCRAISRALDVTMNHLGAKADLGRCAAAVAWHLSRTAP